MKMPSACALAIISGRIILIFGIAERLRTLRYCIFTGGVVAGNGICRAAFCESAALPNQLSACRQRAKRLRWARGREGCSESPLPTSGLHPPRNGPRAERP